MTKKIILQVATKINATSTRPIHSATIAPNSPTKPPSPLQQGVQIPHNNIDITTPVNTNANPFIRNYDNTHSSIIATNVPTNNLCSTRPTTHNTLQSSNQKQYLISHFFSSTTTNSTRSTQGNHLTNNNITANANPTHETSIPHDTTQHSINDSTTNINTTHHQAHNNTATGQLQHQRKRYVQNNILRKPIPNDSWGSSMDTNDPRCFRIYFQNINGLTAGKSMERWNETVMLMQDKKCEILGLAETNTDWKSYNIKTNISRIINKQFINSSTILSENRYNPTKKRSRFQPGGTLQSCTGHWKSRCISIIHDFRNMGRWTGQKFQLRNNTTLTVITAYRPCKNNSINKPTSSTTYRQQTIMLTEDGIINPEPRKIFIEDMIDIIKKYNNDVNNHTILMLDANENINDTEGGLSQLLKETHLIDVFSHISNDECNIPTYVRGSKKIDYILTTISLVPFIKNIGCLPFYMYNNSDHRGLFLDISEKLINAKVELKRPSLRHIGTNCSGYEVYRYKQYIDKQFKLHKIYEKTTHFKTLSNTVSKRELATILNNIDKSITEIMLAAEKRCCKVRHDTNWSVELHLANIMCNYWLKKLKGIKNHIDVSIQTQRLYNKLPKTMQDDLDNLLCTMNPTNMTRVAKQQLRLHINNKKQLLSNHQSLRRLGLDDLKNIRSAKGQQKEAGIIGKIANKEMKKQDWAKLRNIFNPTHKSGITNIEVPDKDSSGNSTTDPSKAITWKRIYNPEQVEACILERNIQHFGQAEGTLFTRDIMIELFDYDGTSMSATDLLEGTLEVNTIPDVTASARTLLDLLSNQQKLPTMDNSISFAEFNNALKKWNESTSTSPSGRHLGHYKVLLRPDYCEELYDQYYTDPKVRILQVYYDILTYASTSGISLRRWQNSTTAMIEKIPGCPKINKLRVIHLYEADYNLILKIIWARKLVWNVHDNNCINAGQAGSRPGCNAIDVIIQKEMKYLYSRLTKSNLATMDNDAKSCYDRIICNLAMIISQYFGVSRNLASLHATTLRKMQYRLRTALGDSTTTYQHSPSTPIHGTGQGSCASPAIWLLISSILMDCLSAMGGGMTMKDVNNDISIQQWIDGFVDDTSLFSNIIQHADNENIVLLCNQLTRDMTIWNELLEASGGKLELSKCFYYVLSWKFDQEGNGIPMTIAEQRNQQVAPIQIQTDNTKFVTILQKEVHTAHKTLGCFKAIDGNEKEQIKYLSDKSRQFGRKLNNASLTRKQALMAYKTIYIPSMRYGLPACSLSCTEMETIQKSTLDKFLPFMGYEHGSPRALIHGPSEMGGCEIPHLYTEMMGLKIESVMAHIRADSLLGKSFRININYIQLLTGLEDPIFMSRDNIGYITDNWLLHLRNYLLEINGSFTIKDLWLPRKLREHDIVLMTEFLSLGLPQSDLRLINNWRLYFKVNTLTEICNPEGTHIRECFTKFPKRTYSNNLNPSKLQWPNQGIPGKRGFRLWLKCLQMSFNMANKGRINHHFGKWIDSHHLIKNNTWNHYVQVSTGSLFSTSKDAFYSIPYMSRRTKSITYQNNRSNLHRVQQLPADCIPTSLRLNRKRNVLIATCSYTTQTERIITTTPPDWKTCFINNIIITDGPKLRNLISHYESTIYIASDGGVYNYEGTFGVILSDGSSTFAQNHGKFYSVDFCESSYRSELFAMLSGILSFKTLFPNTETWRHSSITLKLLSDSRILVNKINNRLKNRRTTNQHRDSDVDLELQLIHELELLISGNIQISITFVRSHQELKKVKSALNHSEVLNIMADELTRSARKIKRVGKYTSLPQNPIDLTINNIIINSKYSLRSKKAYHSTHLRTYFQHKYAWPNKIIDSIWWKPYYNSLSKLSFPEKVIIYKFINDRLPTNARDHKYYSFRAKQCSQCQCDNEDDDHILKCFSIKRQNARREWLLELDCYLSQNHTPRDVKQIILKNFHQFLEPPINLEPIIELDTTDSDKAYHQQNIIGWRHFIRGRISIEWGKLVDSHLSKAKLYHITAEKWAADLFYINWKHILKIWRERCLEIHGNNPVEIERNAKNKCLEEIIHIQSINSNLNYSTYEWIHEDIEELRNFTSKHLQTWLYGAKIISRKNQHQLKQQQQLNCHDPIWHRKNSKPNDEPIGKSDLDPGE
jgi:ribonuclease HI